MKKIVSLSILALILLYITDQIIHVPYLFRILLKILLFGILPILYYKLILKKSLKPNLKLTKKFYLSILIGVVAAIIVLTAYFILQNYIDLNLIASELKDKEKITAVNFIFASIYITVINSFLEEFFFRGFIFLQLYKSKPKLAYIFSSLLFGIYHISIFQTWFNIWIMLLALFGLVVVGFILCWLNQGQKNIINSWTVHIISDMAVMYIGFRMFGFF